VIGTVGGTLLGWSLGANDAANVFGTAVSSRMVPWRTAAWLAAVFVILGAGLQGTEGIDTLTSLTSQTTLTTGLAAFAAALTVATMTAFALPVSTSQAVVGAIIGVGVVHDRVNVAGLGKVIACWIGTPLGGMAFCVLFYFVFRALLQWWRPSIYDLDPALRFGLVLCGCYGAYALGANNVANVATFIVGDGMLGAGSAAVLGGVSIAAGVVTFSKPVMLTVGKGITPLDAFSAFVVVLAQAVTVHIYALVGVPVSTSQAIVGAVLGIGLVRGIHIINGRMLRRIMAGWIATPFIAAAVGAILYACSDALLR